MHTGAAVAQHGKVCFFAPRRVAFLVHWIQWQPFLPHLVLGAREANDLPLSSLTHDVDLKLLTVCVFSYNTKVECLLMIYFIVKHLNGCCCMQIS